MKTQNFFDVDGRFFGSIVENTALVALSSTQNPPAFSNDVYKQAVFIFLYQIQNEINQPFNSWDHRSRWRPEKRIYFDLWFKSY